MALIQTFSTFPDGWPGAGLLMLRAAAGVLLIDQSVAYFGQAHVARVLLAALALAVVAVGLLLLVGLLTRFAALLAAIGIAANMFPWFPIAPAGPLDNPVAGGLATVVAVSVICLGPGAFSLDARLFGRREVIIPPASSNSEAHG